MSALRWIIYIVIFALAFLLENIWLLLAGVILVISYKILHKKGAGS